MGGLKLTQEWCKPRRAEATWCYVSFFFPLPWIFSVRLPPVSVYPIALHMPRIFTTKARVPRRGCIAEIAAKTRASSSWGWQRIRKGWALHNAEASEQAKLISDKGGGASLWPKAKNTYCKICLRYDLVKLIYIMMTFQRCHCKPQTTKSLNVFIPQWHFTKSLIASKEQNITSVFCRVMESPRRIFNTEHPP